jgi:predicted PurR-regulated permease PerM
VTEEPTLGELGRAISSLTEESRNLRTAIEQGHQRLRHDVGNIKTVQAAHSEQIKSNSRHLDAHDKDIERIDGFLARLMWATLAAFGTVLLTVLGLVISKG